MEALDATAIAVPGVQVRVVRECTSTNSVLLEERGATRLLAAEAQTEGRGRRGRRWLGAAGRAILFSLARNVSRSPRELASLSLVAGVATARALHGLGARRVALKWPNDLVAGEAKLGGILVETRSPAYAVFGIGINYLPDPALASRVRRPLASLAGQVGVLPSRNEVIAAVARSLMDALDAFEARGFEALRREWLALDAYAGRRLRVRLADGRSITGVAAGLADGGELQIRTRGGLRAVRSGTVRLA